MAMTEPRHETRTAPVGEPVQASAGKRALAWTHTARFFVTASKLDELPATELPEIAFVGRSNAGKSSAINALAQQRRLAFSSKTPGRTQHINLFEVGPKGQPDAYFADLPGYGYAAVARQAKLRWQEVMADYLAVRRNLGAIVVLVDSRHGFTEIDRNLLNFIAPRVANGAVSLLALLTKVDKLSRNEARRALETATAAMQAITTEESDVALVAFSILSGAGVEDTALRIRRIVHPDSPTGRDAAIGPD